MIFQMDKSLGPSPILKTWEEGKNCIGWKSRGVGGDIFPGSIVLLNVCYKLGVHIAFVVNIE